MINLSKETDATKTVISNLTTSGMLIERVGDDAYNVTSQATGAVLKRQIPVGELIEFQRCMVYIAKQHGAAIAKHLLTAPVHSV